MNGRVRIAGFWLERRKLLLVNVVNAANGQSQSRLTQPFYMEELGPIADTPIETLMSTWEPLLLHDRNS